MSDGKTLSDYAAGEIRATLARGRTTGRELAEKLGVSRSWVSYRLTGTTEITLNDLEKIAAALGVGVADLLPRHARQPARGDMTPEYSHLAERWTSAARPRRRTVRPAHNRPVAKTAGPPNVRDDSRRPVLLPRRI